MEALLVQLCVMGRCCRGFEVKIEAVRVHAVEAYRRRRDGAPLIRIFGTLAALSL